MVISMFDQKFFEFSCKCGEITKEDLSNLDGASSITCRACGAVTSLKSDPWCSYLEHLRYVASELDNQARKHGEVIKRIK